MRSFVQVISRRTLQRRWKKKDKGGKEVKDALSNWNLASSWFLGKFEHKWNSRVFLSKGGELRFYNSSSAWKRAEPAKRLGWGQLWTVSSRSHSWAIGCLVYKDDLGRPYYSHGPWVYWVGQKVHWGFSMMSYRKTQTNFLANPVLCGLAKTVNDKIAHTKDLPLIRRKRV